MAQLLGALRYRPEGRGFDSRWCYWNFSLPLSFRPHCGPGVDSVSYRNEYQEYFLRGKGGCCVGLAILPPSCADCHEIWEPQPSGSLRACPGLWWDCFTYRINVTFSYLCFIFPKADPCCYFKKENGRSSTHLLVKNLIIIPQFLIRRYVVSALNRASLTKRRNHVAFFKVYRLYILMVSHLATAATDL